MQHHLTHEVDIQAHCTAVLQCLNSVYIYCVNLDFVKLRVSFSSINVNIQELAAGLCLVANVPLKIWPVNRTHNTLLLDAVVQVSNRLMLHASVACNTRKKVGMAWPVTQQQFLYMKGHVCANDASESGKYCTLGDLHMHCCCCCQNASIRFSTNSY